MPVTTIDEFCRERGIVPNLIKIDIEGYEFHAIRGAREILSKYHPIVVVEFHPMNWKEIGIDPDQVPRLFAELGYEATPLDGQKDPLAEYGHVVLEPTRQPA